MTDIILINDQGQEQTLAGVEKLVARSADGNQTFFHDPSGGAMAGGYKKTEFPITGTTISGAAEAKEKMIIFTNLVYSAPPQLEAIAYIALNIEEKPGKGGTPPYVQPRGICVRAPISASSGSDFDNVNYPNLDAQFDWRQLVELPSQYAISAYIKGGDLVLRSIKAISTLGGSSTEKEYCDPDTYDITGKLVVIEKIETES